MRFSILLFCSLFSFKMKAQQQKLDSMRQSFANAPNDTVRMRCNNAIAFYYVESNRDSALFYLDKSLEYARSLNLKVTEANFLDFKGYTYMLMGNYSRSLQLSLMALKISENPAVEHDGFLPAVETKRNRRLLSLSNIYYNMGLLFGATGNTEKQISSYQQAMTLAKTVGNAIKQAEIKLSLGETYLSINKLDSASLLEQEGLSVLIGALNSPQQKYLGVACWNIGKIFQQQQQPDSARHYFFRAIHFDQQYNNLSNLADALLSMAVWHQINHGTDSALYYSHAALQTFEKVRRAGGMADAYRFLSKLYAEKNKPDSAFGFLNMAINIKDSINTIEKRNLNEFQNVGFDEQLKLQQLEKEKIQTQNTIRVYSLVGGLLIFSLVAIVLYRNNTQKNRANKELEKTLANLKSTQSQLVQSEKMASLGELTAGIAHEIQNPLNFVNNFSEVSNELIDELKIEKSKVKNERDELLEEELLNDIKSNLEKINHHGKRADAIVKGMLQHSRSSSGVKEPTDINALCDEYLRLSYHGLRAKDKSFNVTLKTDFDESIGKINIIPQDIGRVIMNLLTNAFYAVQQKQKTCQAELVEAGLKYEPTVSISTKKTGSKIEIIVADNGNGIPQNIVDKIFQPFFTTKPTGQGTGLGLSLSYDIITKGHAGELIVETNANGVDTGHINQQPGTTFIIQLPIR